MTDVLQHIKSTLFDANGYPLFSARALANEDFMVAGELISSSLAQGGPAPCFLAKNVFNYMAEGVNRPTTGWSWFMMLISKMKLIR